MLKTLGFVVRFGPWEADDVSKQHFRELMTQRHVFCRLAPFSREFDATGAIYADEIVARETLECVGDGRWSDAKLFR